MCGLGLGRCYKNELHIVKLKRVGLCMVVCYWSLCVYIIGKRPELGYKEELGPVWNQSRNRTPGDYSRATNQAGESHLISNPHSHSLVGCGIYLFAISDLQP